MAKKKSAKSSVNMSGAIRDELTANSALTNKEVLLAVQAKYPMASLNLKSFGVAVSNLRKKMGIGASRKKSVLKKKPGRPPGSAPRHGDRRLQSP